MRTFKPVAAAFVAAAALAASSCSGSTGAGEAAPVGTSTDLASLLGPANKATGEPIKIGFIDDGRTAGIDHTPLIAAFNATVQYANEHLGGINGRAIEVDECSTNNTPSDATNCGVKMRNDGVAAVLVPGSAQDGTIFTSLEGSGIPYFTYAAGAQDIIVKPGAFLLVNPIATLAAPAKIANEDNVKKAAVVIVDVPAAVGPLTAIAKPIYEKAGVDLNVVAIPVQTPDLTPQIQQAISAGAEMFSVIGTDEFNATAIKALKQLGFTGKIVIVTAPSQAMADQVPGGLEGVVYLTSATGDLNDKDVQLYNAVMQTYAKDVVPTAQSVWAYAIVIGFVNALQGNSSAVDAATITRALGSMPKPLPLPLGGGLTYQCGAKVVPLLPNVCTDSALSTTLDAQGQGHAYEKLDVSAYMTFSG